MRYGVDQITTQVIRFAMEQIAEEMGYTLVRTARSTIVKEVMDIGCAVFDRRGRTIAQAHHVPLFVVGFEITMRELLKRFDVDQLREGDVIASNDPYQGGQHLMDMQVFAPVFFEGELVGFVGSVAHQLDLGGAIPGGVGGGMTEIFQEGLRLPMVKLYKGGKEDEEIFAILRNNMRIPDKTIPDIKALVSSCFVGTRRVREVFAKYGVDTVEQCVEGLLNYSERRVRQGLLTISDGDYSATDYMDSDGITDDPVKIQVNIRKRGDQVTVDFTGTSRQTKGNINSPIATTSAAVLYTVLGLADPHAPPNSGCFRPIEIVVEEGSLVNPSPPAAVAARSNTCIKVVEAMMHAFSQAAPTRVVAGSHGQVSTSAFTGIDPKTGKRFGYIEIQGGGAGARPDKDGRDGQDSHLGRFMNTPIEAVEMEFPVRVERFHFITDGAGAGKYRGALPLRKDIRMLIDGISWARYGDRQEFPPFGLFGGLEGAKGRFVLNPGTPSEQRAKSKAVTILKANDVVSLRLPGGGGYGDPRERDVELVRRDVIEGKVSLEAARRDCGVVINPDDFSVDEEQTENNRARGGN